MKILITDLDNTLYDWVTYHSRAFKAMVEELSVIIDTGMDQLLEEFKTLHKHYGNTEQPFAILELPAVKKHFGELSKKELIEKLDRALHAYNSIRKKLLRLYDGVEETLALLKNNGILIAGYTEAIAINGYYRLYRLGILDYFTRLYASEGKYDGHPDPEAEKKWSPSEDFIRTIPICEKKPNPAVLLDICKREKVLPQNAWYVGDSLAKDIKMAKKAGVHSVWARYGCKFDRKLLDIIIKVTHWTKEDIDREEEMRRRVNGEEADNTIDSFRELIPVILRR